jgi:hypothetical protein
MSDEVTKGRGGRPAVDTCEGMLRYEMARRGMRGVSDEKVHAWAISVAIDEAPAGEVVRSLLDQHQGLVAPWEESLERLGGDVHGLDRGRDDG